MKVTKMMEEDFSNVFNWTLHVMKVTKIMDFKGFVSIAAKLVSPDSKTMVLQPNVSP